MEYGNSAKVAAVDARPMFDEMFDSAHTANGRLSTVINRMQRLNDKVFGPRPEEASKPSAPTPVGVAPALRSELDDLHRQLERADQLLTHIERFV